MSAGRINELMGLWAASNVKLGGSAPFKNCLDMYRTIDNVALGDIPWKSFKLCYEGEMHPTESPSWMTDHHTIWYRDPNEVVKNLLANPDFVGEMKLGPHRDYDAAGQRQYSDFLSGDWSWAQAVCFRTLFIGLSSLILSSGCSGCGSEQPRGRSRPHHPGKRQDNGLRHDREHGILPAVSVDRKCHQLCASRPSGCHCCDCVPCPSNR